MSRHLRTCCALALAVAAPLACSDDDRISDVMPSAPAVLGPDAMSAFITVSDPKPGVGDRVTVTVRAIRGASVGRIGSFTLSLAYGAKQLRFIEAGRSAYGMVLANGAERGMVKAAGASAEGFADDQLITAVFEVAAPNAMETLQLTVSEMNSVAFHDQRAQMRVERALYRENRR
ncbi:MAG: hypothetical protein AABZ80_13565 [Gemmatimonadota bacterium]